MERRLNDYARHYGPNHRQTQALMMTHRTRMTLVQGPPGTGKTTMAALVLGSFVAQESKILLTIASNAPVVDV